MKVAIITIAGISGRFNEGIAEENKVLKAIYSKNGMRDTLLYHLMVKCCYADKIILVGGYKFTELQAFYKEELERVFPQVDLIENEHYSDLGSGYSLYLGLLKAFEYDPEEVLFVEGDLDIDDESFARVIDSQKSVLTYTKVPIYTNKAVVLYKNGEGKYKYAFNSAHGLLKIDEFFSCILNSGQTWKFTDMDALKRANEFFFENEIDGTNLKIIQGYVEAVSEDDIELIQLERWTNCNTRYDYNTIVGYWRGK